MKRFREGSIINKGVSVVIPTVGESTLQDVIIALNKGSLVPREIIVCFPKEKLELVESLKLGNVKLIQLDINGQVKQRVAGFKVAKFKYVLAIDSDFVVNNDTVQNLVLALEKMGPKSVIGPNHNNEINKNLLKKPSKWNIFRIVMNLLEDSRVQIPPGTITKTGSVKAGSIPLEDIEDISTTQFISGGCSLHLKKNLVLEDYYPFAGKAYGEDVIHSILLRKKGLSLYVSRSAEIKNEGAGDYTFDSFSDLILYLDKLRKINLFIVKLQNGSLLRMGILNVLFNIKQLLKFLIGKSKV